MREAIETIEKGGFTARLFYDEDPQSPKEWDQLGTLVTWHRRYRFDQDGQKDFNSPEDFLAIAKEEGWIYLPVAMYEHSGITLWVGKGPHAFDQQGWDSGQVGFIYATKESIEKIGTPADKVKEVLSAEVETWDQFVRGDVYGFVIEDAEGNDLDSCWGFYGFDYAKGEMKAGLDAVIQWEAEEMAKIARMEAL